MKFKVLLHNKDLYIPSSSRMGVVMLNDIVVVYFDRYEKSFYILNGVVSMLTHPSNILSMYVDKDLMVCVYEDDRIATSNDGIVWSNVETRYINAVKDPMPISINDCRGNTYLTKMQNINFIYYQYDRNNSAFRELSDIERKSIIASDGMSYEKNVIIGDICLVGDPINSTNDNRIYWRMVLGTKLKSRIESTAAIHEFNGKFIRYNRRGELETSTDLLEWESHGRIFIRGKQLSQYVSQLNLNYVASDKYIYFNYGSSIFISDDGLNFTYTGLQIPKDRGLLRMASDHYLVYGKRADFTILRLDEKRKLRRISFVE